MKNFTFTGDHSFEFTCFRDLLIGLHRRYYVAFVRLKNNDVYLADEKVGYINAIPSDYKELK